MLATPMRSHRMYAAAFQRNGLSLRQSIVILTGLPNGTGAMRHHVSQYRQYRHAYKPSSCKKSALDFCIFQTTYLLNHH